MSDLTANYNRSELTYNNLHEDIRGLINQVADIRNGLENNDSENLSETLKTAQEIFRFIEGRYEELDEILSIANENLSKLKVCVNLFADPPYEVSELIQKIQRLENSATTLNTDYQKLRSLVSNLNRAIGNLI